MDKRKFLDWFCCTHSKFKQGWAVYVQLTPKDVKSYHPQVVLFLFSKRWHLLGWIFYHLLIIFQHVKQFVDVSPPVWHVHILVRALAIPYSFAQMLSWSISATSFVFTVLEWEQCSHDYVSSHVITVIGRALRGRAGMFSSCLRSNLNFNWEKNQQDWTSRLILEISIHTQISDGACAGHEQGTSQSTAIRSTIWVIVPLINATNSWQIIILKNL